MVRRIAWGVLIAGACIISAIGTWQWRTSRAETERRAMAKERLSSGAIADIRLERVWVDRYAAPPVSGAGLAAPCTAVPRANCDEVSRRGDHAPMSTQGVADRPAGLRSLVGFHGDERHLLLILFAPTDCSLCLQESALWRELAAASGKDVEASLAVVAIVDRTTPEEMRTVAQQLGLSFPIFVDAASRVRELLGAETTPFKVLLSAGDEVKLVDGPNQLTTAQQEFARRVREVTRRGPA
ncbi:MAG: hypothetical protein ACRDK3_07120 [Actinomycetota bacterium]